MSYYNIIKLANEQEPQSLSKSLAGGAGGFGGGLAGLVALDMIANKVGSSKTDSHTSLTKALREANAKLDAANADPYEIANEISKLKSKYGRSKTLEAVLRSKLVKGGIGGGAAVAGYYGGKKAYDEYKNRNGNV